MFLIIIYFLCGSCMKKTVKNKMGFVKMFSILQQSHVTKAGSNGRGGVADVRLYSVCLGCDACVARGGWFRVAGCLWRACGAGVRLAGARLALSRARSWGDPRGEQVQLPERTLIMPVHTVLKIQISIQHNIVYNANNSRVSCVARVALFSACECWCSWFCVYTCIY